MKKSSILTFMVLTSISFHAQEISCRFNPENVILPSSQYSAEDPYSASVWVFNDGQKYSDAHYNYIWATPPADSNGTEWYSPLYAEEDSKWQNATAPFSSDEYYRGQKSFQWVNVDIMGEIYIRRPFIVDHVINQEIFLTCGHDDAPSEWYINGELVYTASDGWNNDDYVLLTPEQKSLIKMDGSENVLAVHVHQNWGGAFADCGLYYADMFETRSILPTVEDGPWPCKYYMLNYNSDLEMAEAANWASEDEDESDWIEGFGPFSNDENMFFTTEWPSQERPLLVRRHFSISDSDLNLIPDSELCLKCSYDENPKVYLNGTLIWQAEGWNDNNYVSVPLSDEYKSLIHEGDNVLAVSLTSGGGGGHIDYGLIMENELHFGSVAAPMVNFNCADSRIFNIHGQYLGNDVDNLPKGIYIQGNKKFVKL